MRDDLFCFTFLQHRVCVSLDEDNCAGWSYTIDGGEEPIALQDLSWSQRVMLEEAGIAARDRIRSMYPAAQAFPFAGGAGRFALPGGLSLPAALR